MRWMGINEDVIFEHSQSKKEAMGTRPYLPSLDFFCKPGENPLAPWQETYPGDPTPPSREQGGMRRSPLFGDTVFVLRALYR